MSRVIEMLQHEILTDREIETLVAEFTYSDDDGLLCVKDIQLCRAVEAAVAERIEKELSERGGL